MLDATARFEALVELLNAPALLVPADALRGLIKAVQCAREQQNPLDAVLCVPDAQHRGVQWLAALVFGVVDRWAHLHGAPRQAQLQSPGRLARASPLRHHQLALRGQRSSGLQQLARACGASVNEQPRQAVPTQPPRSAPVVVRVATSVTNADPSMASGGTPKRLQNQGPDLGLKAFALLALDTVLGALAGRPAATSPTPLGGKAEDLPGCAKRHQAVHHQAAASVIADGTVALGRSHVREVQLCGVLYKPQRCHRPGADQTLCTAAKTRRKFPPMSFATSGSCMPRFNSPAT